MRMNEGKEYGKCEGIWRGGARERLLMNIHHAAAAKAKLMNIKYFNPTLRGNLPGAASVNSFIFMS